MRVILGILKGGIIGGGLGYGFYILQLGGLLNWLLYPLIGALVGFIAGRPFWSHETIWTPVVKAIVGLVVGAGLYALVAKALGDPGMGMIKEGATLTSLPYLLGGAIGVVYGVFVEIDDGGKGDKASADPRDKNKGQPRRG